MTAQPVLAFAQDKPETLYIFHPRGHDSLASLLLKKIKEVDYRAVANCVARAIVENQDIAIGLAVPVVPLGVAALSHIYGILTTRSHSTKSEDEVSEDNTILDETVPPAIPLESVSVSERVLKVEERLVSSIDSAEPLEEKRATPLGGKQILSNPFILKDQEMRAGSSLRRRRFVMSCVDDSPATPVKCGGRPIQGSPRPM